MTLKWVTVRIKCDLSRIADKSLVHLKERVNRYIIEKQGRKLIVWRLLQQGKASLSEDQWGGSPYTLIGRSTWVVTGGVVFEESLSLRKLERKCLSLLLVTRHQTIQLIFHETKNRELEDLRLVWPTALSKRWEICVLPYHRYTLEPGQDLMEVMRQ